MAIRIDATADRLTAAATLPAVTSGITITGWINRKVNNGTFSTWIRLHTGGTGGGSTVITSGTGTTGVLGYGYYTAAGSVELNQSVPQDTWVPVAVTHDTGTTGKSYARLSGTTYVASGAVGSGTPTGITLGGRDSTDAGEWFNGEIAHFRIWSAELTQAEIEAEWASPTPVKTSGLLYNWPLADATDLTDTVASKTLVTQSGGTPTTATGPFGGSTTGVVAGSLPSPGGSLAGTVTTNTGALAGSLPTPGGSLAGIAGSTSGAAAGSLPALGGAIAGTVFTPGVVAGAFPALGGTLTGVLRASGALSGELPALSGALTGVIASLGIIRGALPTLGGSLNDLVTLLTQDSYALDVHRENTRAFIAADPFSVTLRTRTDVRTATGGRVMTDGSFRSPQVGKLIMMSPAGGSIEQRTQDGTERQVDFILLLEWDAEIEVGDWWDDQQGNRWEVKALIPTNNYEIRAVVEAHGKQMTGG